jgi:8-oxo-dGTP pyrophosphatase MutT (NUDIX family)
MSDNNYRTDIEQYIPLSEAEETDKKNMLEFIEHNENVLLRENGIAHMTASSWIINQDATKVLMIYHNIYGAWSWTGGHADGDSDLLGVAIREAKEETGVEHIKAVDESPVSLEIITVENHYKKGRFVSSHLHLNVTYLLMADEQDTLHIKPDENKGVRWFPVEELIAAVDEPCMIGIYEKLMERTRKIMNK